MAVGRVSLYVIGGREAKESDVVSTTASGCAWPPCVSGRVGAAA
jgi:hypothetical protein